jgi:hypothetical protein
VNRSSWSIVIVRAAVGAQRRHASNLFTTPDQFRWTHGEHHVKSYDVPEAERFGVNFCTICGSDVARLSPKVGRVNIPGGSLDTDPRIRPGYHIFVGSKAPWYDITDNLPQHQELPG